MHRYVCKSQYILEKSILHIGVDCGTLVDPTNGLVAVTDTIFNSTATYSCNNGYNLVGDTTRTCLASGSWSDTAPTCTGLFHYSQISKSHIGVYLQLLTVVV